MVDEGIYPVRITNIEKKEAQKYQSEEMETILLFEFSIDEDRRLFKRIRPSLSVKPNPSHLYNIWAAVEGRKPSEDEFKDFHLSALLGKTLRIVVSQQEKGGETYNKIESFMGAEKPKETKEEEK